MHQLMKVFGDVEPFLKSSDDFSGNTRAKLLEYFANSTKIHALKVELALVVDAGKPFVEATYKLELDGPIVLECFVVISAQWGNQNGKLLKCTSGCEVYC